MMLCVIINKSPKGTMKKIKTTFLKWILSTVFAAIIAYMVWESLILLEVFAIY